MDGYHVTTYAHVIDAIIRAEGSLPATGKRLDNGADVLDLRSADADTQRACGWYRVTDPGRPADTATHTADRTVTFDGSAAVAVWTTRPKTQGERDAEAAAAATVERRSTRGDARTKLEQRFGHPTNARDGAATGMWRISEQLAPLANGDDHVFSVGESKQIVGALMECMRHLIADDRDGF